ncbi:MAG: hypothetical protein WC570_00580 [Patescibacteria group bacterium]
MNNQEQFINELIADLGFSNLPDEQKNELKQSLTERIEQKLFHDVMNNLNEEQQKMVAEKIENKVDMMDILNYIAEVMPDFVNVLQASMTDSKKEIMADMQRIDGAIEDQTK